MNFLEHVEKIEEIIKEEKEAKRTNSLMSMGAQSAGVGMGFSTMQMQANTIGGVTHINTISNGQMGYSTLSTNACGTQLIRHW